MKLYNDILATLKREQSDKVVFEADDQQYDVESLIAELQELALRGEGSAIVRFETYNYGEDARMVIKANRLETQEEMEQRAAIILRDSLINQYGLPGWASERD